MITEKQLQECAALLAAHQYINRPVKLSLDDMHDVLGTLYAADQHQIIKSLTCGHGVGAFHYLREREKRGLLS